MAFRTFVLSAAALASPVLSSLAQEPVQDRPVLDPRVDMIAPEDRRTVELSLAEALRIAISNDIGLAIEGARAEAFRFAYAGSWGAFDPVLTARATYSDNEFEGQTTLAGAPVLESDDWTIQTGLALPLQTGGLLDVRFDHVNELTNNQFAVLNPSTTDLLNLSLTQPLLRGAWNQYATTDQRTADLQFQQQLEASRNVRQILLRDVTNAYWDLVAARENLSVASVTLELAERQLDQNQRRLDAGVGTEVEVLQAQANVAVRVQEGLLAQVGVGSAVDVLKSFLFPGTEAATWDLDVVPVTELPEADDVETPKWQEALARAIELRAELAQQRLVIEATEVQLARASSDRLPALDLVLSANSRGFDGDPQEAFAEAFEFEFLSTSAGLNFSLPIPNRTARHAFHRLRQELRIARLVYDQLETQITTEVRSAARDVIYQAEALRAARVSLGLARRQLEAEESRLREGLSTTFAVLEFQRDLAAALSSETASRVAYAKAIAQLLAAQGRLDEVVR